MKSWKAHARVCPLLFQTLRAAARKVGVEIEQTDTPEDVVNKIAAKREEADLDILPFLDRRGETAEDIIDDVERGDATAEQAAERLEAIDVDPADVGGEVLDAAARANAQRALDEPDVDEAAPLIKESQQAIADKVGTVTQARKIINAAAGGKKLPKAERQQLAAQVARTVNKSNPTLCRSLKQSMTPAPISYLMKCSSSV